MTVDFTAALPEGLNQRMVEEGRNIFHDRGGCVRCHGKDGAGTFFGPALANRQHIHLQTGTPVTDLFNDQHHEQIFGWRSPN
jgi:mono/diheme cytochrome c family protein